VYGSGRVGRHPGAPDGVITGLGPWISARLLLPVRRAGGRVGGVDRGDTGARHAVRASYGAHRGAGICVCGDHDRDRARAAWDRPSLFVVCLRLGSSHLLSTPTPSLAPERCSRIHDVASGRVASANTSEHSDERERGDRSCRAGSFLVAGRAYRIDVCRRTPLRRITLSVLWPERLGDHAESRAHNPAALGRTRTVDALAERPNGTRREPDSRSDRIALLAGGILPITGFGRTRSSGNYSRTSSRTL